LISIPGLALWNEIEKSTTQRVGFEKEDSGLPCHWMLAYSRENELAMLEHTNFSFGSLAAGQALAFEW
jgi:hypothetical protein